MNVLYDISRLSTRVLNPTPNGIDWIDRLYADHFLDDRREGAWPLLFGPFGPRLFAPGGLANPTAALAQAWDATAAEAWTERIAALADPAGSARATAAAQAHAHRPVEPTAYFAALEAFLGALG